MRSFWLSYTPAFIFIILFIIAIVIMLLREAAHIKAKRTDKAMRLLFAIIVLVISLVISLTQLFISLSKPMGYVITVGTGSDEVIAYDIGNSPSGIFYVDLDNCDEDVKVGDVIGKDGDTIIKVSIDSVEDNRYRY